MKARTKSIILALTFFVIAFANSSTFAANRSDKVTEKAREAVKKASPDDWHTLANSAEKCLKKKVNLKEVAEWLDKSISIKETPYNLTLKGDYYRINKLPEKAMEFYVKAISEAMASDINADTDHIQQRIADIKNM
ncbi:MAG: hypothetical protein ACFCUU_10180 [Cyclobacteriaceae bacterium]